MSLFLSKKKQLSTKPFLLLGFINTLEEDMLKILTFRQVDNCKIFYLFNKIKVWKKNIKTSGSF